MIVLKPGIESRIPVEAECISPDIFSDKSVSKIEKLSVLEGNEERKLESLFDVGEKEGDERTIEIRGDVPTVRRIGTEMCSGKITIKGDAGMHLGCEMEGGEITVEGDAGDWTGENMNGGVIRIKGDGGNFLGAASWGKNAGMTGGIITVGGETGRETGKNMRRGIIAVKGDTGNFAGNRMTGGTIICYGDFGDRPGAGMDRGTLIAYNPPELLPTFKYNSTYNPNFLRVLLQELEKYDLPIEKKHITGSYERYSGDLAALGKGEVLVWKG
ncbi:hypothetical protein AKJ65_02715 [candidate division MSBL1 archaeon SCGC-AAA259E19]|uniref:formylmethanofuran dehydrogenase n=1 Tax=candidate division MSBL1 archaeon SCGC-AAA259E19 TaxID=1698264 RepID=A0A133ULQ7_9EURY|nr:hypothetical protein AKJ65_02715 [candidate division MSBL1 archaeon SCGC-AAA259E19]